MLGRDRLAEVVGAGKVDLPAERLDVTEEAGLDQLEGTSLFGIQSMSRRFPSGALCLQ